jgi:hypothetical protein
MEIRATVCTHGPGAVIISEDEHNVRLPGGPRRPQHERRSGHPSEHLPPIH